MSRKRQKCDSPSDLPTVQAVLSILQASEDRIASAIQNLRDQMQILEEHQRIFQRITSIFCPEPPIDLVDDASVDNDTDERSDTISIASFASSRSHSHIGLPYLFLEQATRIPDVLNKIRTPTYGAALWISYANLCEYCCHGPTIGFNYVCQDALTYARLLFKELASKVTTLRLVYKSRRNRVSRQMYDTFNYLVAVDPEMAQTYVTRAQKTLQSRAVVEQYWPEVIRLNDGRHAQVGNGKSSSNDFDSNRRTCYVGGSWHYYDGSLWDVNGGNYLSSPNDCLRDWQAGSPYHLNGEHSAAGAEHEGIQNAKRQRIAADEPQLARDRSKRVRPLVGQATALLEEGILARGWLEGLQIMSKQDRFLFAVRDQSAGAVSAKDVKDLIKMSETPELADRAPSMNQDRLFWQMMKRNFHRLFGGGLGVITWNSSDDILEQFFVFNPESAYV